MQGSKIFQKVMGCIIANMLSAEYNEWMADYFTNDNKSNYLKNKCTEAYKAEQKVIDKLKIIDADVKREIEEIKDKYSDLIFDIMALEEKDQNRIFSLLKKIKKECASTQTQS